MPPPSMPLRGQHQLAAHRPSAERGRGSSAARPRTSRKPSSQLTAKPAFAGRSGVTHAALLHDVDPASVGTELRPTCTTQRQHRRIGMVVSSGGVSDSALAVIVQAGPAMPRVEHHARPVESPQPRAQQRRCLQLGGKHPAAATDERLSPSSSAHARMSSGGNARRRAHHGAPSP